MTALAISGDRATVQRATFEVALDTGRTAQVDGLILGDLGIHIGLTHFADVTHLPTGRRVSGFRTLGGALEFAQRVQCMVAWGRTPFELSPAEHVAITEVARYIFSTEANPVLV